MLFLPELTILLSGLVLFLVSLGTPSDETVKKLALGIISLVVLTTLVSLGREGTLFFESYQVNSFTQMFKLFVSVATLIVISFSGSSPGIKDGIKAEYYLFLFMGLLGLMMLVSSVELLAIFIALELSSFAVYIMVPMRRPPCTR